MTLERRNPLPVGRYWVDVFDPNGPTWETFSRLPTVKVESTEHFEANAGGPARGFAIFRTLAPTAWPTKLGFPTVAGSAVQSSEDTVTKPPPEPDAAAIAEGLIGKAFFGLGLVLGGAVVVGRLLSRK